ncbi:hypothetical protein B0H21DRAFT_711689 [Amylocystis lapponica]|nr:hypothetical protein B0H21DRAFT_711689 [Amylocystis lapponica]
MLAIASIVSEPGPSGAHAQHYPGGMEREGGGQALGADRSSPSVSSSQGDMADTEMEAGQSQQSEGREATESAPKKKRTRTLTTPHQSAVLHALLAQSRFPTTAMREEVGRSIGLSARKVQNQRQKARRPRGQPTAPLTRPPQYGPFSNMPPDNIGEVGTSGGSPTREGYSMRAPQYSAAGPSRRPDASSERHPPYMTQPYPRSMGISQLSGPGIPGPSSSSRAQYPSALDAHMAAEGLHPPTGYPGPPIQPAYGTTRPTSGTSSLDPYRLGPRSMRLHGTSSAGDPRQQLDYPITLPPIVEPTQPRTGALGTSSSTRYPPLAPISSLAPVPPPSAMAEHHRRLASQTESPFAHAPALNIPPPFTLQPRPQWDDTALSPFSRPGSSSLSRPGSSYDIPPGPAYAPGMGPFPGSSAGVPPSVFDQPRSLEGSHTRPALGQPHPLHRFEHTQTHTHDPTRRDSLTERPDPSPFDDTSHEK